MNKLTGGVDLSAAWASVPEWRRDILCFVVIAIGLALAYLRRFVQDDAFISFVYARSLVEGGGLTWFGERVEGFTNPLWTLLVAAGIATGLDAIVWSYVLGMSCFVGSLLLCNQILKRHVNSPIWAAAGLLILATNHSFFAYATGGLETMLQTLMLLICLDLTDRMLDKPLASAIFKGWLGVAYGVAILNRLDSAIFLSVLSAFLAVHFCRTGGRIGLVKSSLQMLLPFCIIVVPFFAWKLSFYGDLLPNTYYAKSGASLVTWVRGAIYVLGFLSLYLFLPVVLLLLAKRDSIQAVPRRSGRLILMIVSLCLAWWLYVIKNGGDFMEYRFLVPTLPLLVLGITVALDQAGRELKRTVFVLLMLGSLLEFFATELLGTRWGVFRKGYASISALDISSEHWDRVGKTLGAVFEASPQIVVAVKPAGAIPFYSRLRSIDMLGLNDKWVATHGEYDPNAPPGHKRKATFPYLLDRDVNLVVGHPRLRSRAEPRPTYDLDFVESQFIAVPQHLRARACESRMLEIPIEPSAVLVVWVLTPDDKEIVTAAAKRGLESFPLQDCLA
jgi:arabinofuranosyltransferase